MNFPPTMEVIKVFWLVEQFQVWVAIHLFSLCAILNLNRYLLIQFFFSFRWRLAISILNSYSLIQFICRIGGGSAISNLNSFLLIQFICRLGRGLGISNSNSYPLIKFVCSLGEVVPFEWEIIFIVLQTIRRIGFQSSVHKSAQTGLLLNVIH